MSTATKMTWEERKKLMDEYGKAWDRGDYDGAWEIGKKIPIHPALVPWVKECMTEEEIREEGLILSES